MRNEGKAKGGYYRSPEVVIKTIARYLKLPAYQREVTLLDPCCGKGIALDLLAKELRRIHADWEGYKLPKLTTYGIEPNKAREYRASRRVNHCITASFFEAVITNSSVSACLLNPPYDFDDEAIRKNGSRERLEVSFLRKATIKLAPGGVLIFIIPQHVLKDAAQILASYYQDFTFFRFPDTEWDPREEEEKKQGGKVEEHLVSMYGQFKQGVLLCRKHAFQQVPLTRDIEQLEAWASMGEEAPILSLERGDLAVSLYALPSPQRELTNFAAKAFDPDKAAQMCSIIRGESTPNLGVWASPSYQKNHWPSPEDQRLSVGRPMAPLKKSHLAILAVAGFINGSTLVGRDGTRLTIKGYSRKVPVKKVRDDEEAVTITRTDRYESALIAINPDSMQLYCIDAGKPMTIPFTLPMERMTMEAFLENFGTALTEEIARTNPALYMGEFQVPWAKDAFKQLLRRPLGRQRDFILAQVNYLMNVAKRSGEIAAMASGKTYLSAGIAHLGDLWVSGLTEQFPTRYIGRKTNRRKVKPPHLFPVVVLCPEIMTYKWKREVEATIPNVKAVVVQRIDTVEKAAELKQFDPRYDGTFLSAIGCMDIITRRIERELSWWEEQFAEAQREGVDLPKKPAHVVIINSSTAKMGMEWVPCYHLRPLRTKNDEGKITLLRDPETARPVLVPSCPHCGHPIKNQERVRSKSATDSHYKKVLLLREALQEKGERQAIVEEEIEEPIVVFMSEQEIWGSPETRKKHFCSECHGALWQYATAAQTSWQSTSPLSFREGEIVGQPLPLPGRDARPQVLKSTVKRRYAVADYLRKQYPGFFNLLITDEIHQGADGTALGLARESLMRASKRTVGLTGTLCNGKASSLLPLLRMVNQGVMEEFGYNGTAEWVKAYGVKQTSVKHYKERDDFNTVTGAVTKRRASIGKPVEKEIAGFSPQGLRWVLDCCNFLELSDVAPNLPKRREYIHIVPLKGTALGEAYDNFSAKITNALGQMLVRGDKSGLSAWFNALLIYPNLPWKGFVCQVKKTGEFLGEAPALPENAIYPKERELITYVEKQHAQGRRVLVYAENTGTYDILPRLQKLLVQHVKSSTPLVVKVLRSETVKPIHREEWLRKTVEEGVDVLICNPTLVQVGLDLIDFPSIVFYQIPTSTSKLRQASRRNHRPGQKVPCEVVYLAYPTMEMRMLSLMAQKTRTSMMVEGQIGQEGLVSFQGDDDEESGDSLALSMANAILKAMEQDIVEGSTHAMEHLGEELQAMFTEAQEIEQEMQTTVALDTSGHLVESSANKYLEVEEEGEEEGGEPKEKAVPVVLAEITQHLLVIPAHSEESGIVEEPLVEPVVVVPITQITDPWEILLAQMKGQQKGGKSRKKKGEESAIAASGVSSLWAS